MADLDPRLVRLYDGDNPDGPDHEFYRRLAEDFDARSVVDLGCGTGLLTVTLATDSRTVVGIDPDRNMLDYARRRPGHELVTWVRGDSTAIEPGSADLVVMTGNVAQHILGEAWPRTLRDLHAGLRRGGRLAFESRNPALRAWEGWAAESPTTRETPIGTLTEWMELVSVGDDGEVVLEAHNIFVDTGERLVEPLVLAFRSAQDIRDQLASAGFEVERVFGGWDREPLRQGGDVMVFVARRP